MPKISRSTRKIKLRTGLLKQLERDGKTEEYWYDLVLDYLAFWEIKEKLKTEIERNGAMVTTINGSQRFRKTNEAVKELPRIHKRMTEILAVLDIKPIDAEEEDDDSGF